MIISLDVLAVGGGVGREGVVKQMLVLRKSPVAFLLSTLRDTYVLLG